MKSSQPVSVVTGAAGFLGSHLTDLLIARNHRVIGIDNFVTGNKSNLAHLRGSKSFRFIKQDICKPIHIPGRVDFVWNFASPASPIDYLKIPIETLQVGAVGTLNTLELARQKKARFLMASTSEIYGDPLVHPQTEDYWGNVNTIGPRGCYDEAKRFSEAATMAYHRAHKLKTRIVRIFNTYGPRMRLNDGRVVPAFIAPSTFLAPATTMSPPRTRSAPPAAIRIAWISSGVLAMRMWLYTAPPFCARPAISITPTPLPSRWAAIPIIAPMVTIPVPPMPVTIIP